MDEGKVVILLAAPEILSLRRIRRRLSARRKLKPMLFEGHTGGWNLLCGPEKDPNATRFDHLTHKEVLDRGLAVMDTAAVALARENNIPIIVYSIHENGGLAEILQGKGRCTIVSDN